MDDPKTATAEISKPRILFRAFLIGCPPGDRQEITDLAKVWNRGTTGDASYALTTPDIQLHCGENACDSVMVFRSTNGGWTFHKPKVWENFFISYVCSNCQTSTKTFALAARWDGQGTATGSCRKFGEFPAYGPPSPPRLFKLIASDRETFLKGRRCENQGLGIGAYAYYRRVVENQKDRILGEIAKVAQITGATEAAQKLKAAVTERRFSKALDDVKEAIPAALMINGHSPLALLHKATSRGLHELNDAECLERANAIRVVLIELSERLGHALKDDKELKKAVSRLMSSDERPPRTSR